MSNARWIEFGAAAAEAEKGVRRSGAGFQIRPQEVGWTYGDS
jgi:hypothetical protein